MDVIDTHCHIQEVGGVSDVAIKWRKGGVTDADDLIDAAKKAGVRSLICVGCTLADSQLAVEFVQHRKGTWASIGIHPHEAKRYSDDQFALQRFGALASRPKVVAVGECGLDFFYGHSPREAQERVLRFQIELALAHNLPLIFHVREAFSEFWPIFDSYKGVRGVIHSFSATPKDVEDIVRRGLYIGLNGIMTFTRDEVQLAAAKAVPLEKMVLETDAPFLTPVPDRGKLCEPKHVRVTAEFLAKLRGEKLTDLAARTTANAQKLFGI